MSRACIVDTHLSPPLFKRREAANGTQDVLLQTNLFWERTWMSSFRNLRHNGVPPLAPSSKRRCVSRHKKGRDECLSHVWPIHPRLVGSQTAWHHTLFKGKSTSSLLRASDPSSLPHRGKKSFHDSFSVRNPIREPFQFLFFFSLTTTLTRE